MGSGLWPSGIFPHPLGASPRLSARCDILVLQKFKTFHFTLYR